MSVAEAGGIEQKVTLNGTDCARTMMAAVRQLPFQHIVCSCVAQILQRSLTVCLNDCGRQMPGQFKHSPANNEKLHQAITAFGKKKGH